MKDGDLLLADIHLYFQLRCKPLQIFSDPAGSDEISRDVSELSQFSWEELSCDQLEKYPDAIFGFTPEAFCYYLPGIMAASVKEGCPNLVVIASLIYMLDRNKDKSMWDVFFSDRWLLLTPSECKVIQSWILWLSSSDAFSHMSSSLDKAFDVLSEIAAS